MSNNGVARRARLFAYLALVVYLTFLGGTFYSDFNLGLRVFHQVAITLLLGSWLVGLLLRKEGMPGTGLEAPMLLLMGVRLLSGWTGMNPRMSVELFWRPITHLVGLYWLVWLFRRRGWGLLYRAFFLTTGVVCIVGLIEFAGWYVGLPFLPVFQQGWLQIDGLASPIPPVQWRLNFTLSNATSLSSYLSLLIPPALAMAFRARRTEGRVAWLGLTGMALVVQLLTRSRGGLLALVVSLPLLATGMVVIYRVRLVVLAQRFRRSKLSWIATGGLLLAAGGFAAMVLPSYLGRVSTIHVRFELWRCALEMIAGHPLLGVGTGLFGQAFRSCLSLHASNYEQFTNAHNLYLNVAAESGLPALAALGWLLVALARVAWRRWRNADSDQERVMVAGTLAALLGFAANCLVDTLPATPLVLPVMILVAWLVAPVSGSKRSASTMRRGMVGAAAMLAVLAVYAAGLLRVDLGQLHFERSLQAAGRGELKAAVVEIDRARVIDPGLELYDFQRAYYLGVLAESKPDEYLESALEAATGALEWDHTYSLHLANLAALNWQAGDEQRAIADIQRAIEINPPDVSHWLDLGVMLEGAGRRDDALLAYATVLTQAPRLAGSGFWQASDFRREHWPDILSLIAERGGASSELWLAAGDLERAVRVSRDTNSAGGYTNLGRALSGLGQFEEALAALDRAVGLCPGCAAAYVARAELHWLMGLSEAATRDAQVALFISPYGAARAYYVLGQIAFAAGDVEEAKTLYWRAIPPQFSSQNWEVVLYNRRALFLPLPQRTRIGGGMAEAEPWLALADIHLAENRPEDAANIYRLLLDRDPYLPEVQRRLDELSA